MGMKDWLKKQQEKIEDKLQKAKDPKVQKEAAREDVKKNAERVVKLFKIAKEGLETYKKVAEKVDDVKTEAEKKFVDLAEKTQPLAEKVDDAAAAIGEKAKKLFNDATKKVEEIKKDQAGKPTTGSGVIDLITPAIPENDGKKNSKDSPKP